MKIYHLANHNASTHPAPPNRPSLLPAAMWYARHGYFVLPLRPGTKTTFKDIGVYQATCDVAQIAAWWGKWPNANIGLAAGKSGLVVLDFDTYKPGAAKPADIGIGADPATVIVESARGGMHIWYRLPAGMTAGNSEGILPDGINVRGVGGYVVAPPSRFEDKKYRFRAGHKPTDLPLAILPATIAAMLATKPTEGPQKANITFAVDCPAKPELSQWRLAQSVLGLIVKGVPKKIVVDGVIHERDRSRVCFGVTRVLLSAGLSPDEIRAVYYHYAIGEKYRELGKKGDRWLAGDIAKLVATRSTPSTVTDGTAATVDPAIVHLPKLLEWVNSAGCIAALRAEGIKRGAAEYRETILAMVKEAITGKSTTVRLSLGELALNLSFSTSKLSRQRARLVKAGWLNVAAAVDGYTTLIDLSPLYKQANFEWFTTAIPLMHISLSLGASGGGYCSYESYLADHVGDEVYRSYPVRFARKRRPNAEILPCNLNSVDLSIVAVLYDSHDGGELPQPRLASITGYPRATVGRSLRKLASLGLLFVAEGERRRKYYSIHPDFDRRLDDLRPKLPSYGLRTRIASAVYGARADGLAKRLDSRYPLDAGERSKLCERRERNDNLQMACRNGLVAMGFDLSAKLGSPRPPRHRSKVDVVEVFNVQHKPLLTAYRGLDGSYQDRLHALACRQLPGDDCTKDQYLAQIANIERRLKMAWREERRLARHHNVHSVVVDDDWLVGSNLKTPALDMDFAH